MTINLNQEVQIMENQIEVELNSFYLRNDGKVVKILEKLTPYRLSAKDGAEYISSLIFFGSDEYYYANNGKAYTNEVMEEFETFLVAQIEFTPLTVPADEVEEAQDKLCSK